ncbi:CCN family member 2 isoform X2 [Xenopus laevis]|nr:CCN family member 2 isoform X2 [Xenopus laevis]
MSDTCTAEVEKISDTCGCGCEVCAQEDGDICDGLRPCNPNQNLSCEYPDLQGKPGVCRDISKDRETITKPVICNKDPTEWTPCSRSCGFGQSLRIKYDKETCTSRAEKRLCMIRPCKGDYSTANYTLMKITKNCNRVLRWSEPLRLNHRGCHTKHPLRPKFCGLCSDGRKCFPSDTETRSVPFKCPLSSKIVKRQFMWVVKCQCKNLLSAKNGKAEKGHKKKKERERKEEKFNTIEEEM